MPAFAAHYFFSRRVYKKLDPKLQELIKKYKESVDYYDLGAQGPDIFLFYKPYKKNNINTYGELLHRKQARKLFVETIDKIKKEDDWVQEMAMIYLFGLCNHFTLDSYAHPKIAKITKDFNEHMLLETELDRLFIEKFAHRKADKEYKFRRQFLFNPTLKYGYYLNFVYPAVDVKKIQEAIYQTRYYMKKLYSPYFVKGKIIQVLSKKFGKGNDFSKMIIKKNVDHTYDNLNKQLMIDLDKIIDLAVDNINNLYQYYLGNDKLSSYFNRNFE
ncbi:MAG: zinc dependent phospholipase C family protein [Bacilli bacterium]|jgi:hypothetical protein|nr:zinc dependent phospholipase C family protein [Bacilli bacterium]